MHEIHEHQRGRLDPLAHDLLVSGLTAGGIDGRGNS